MVRNMGALDRALRAFVVAPVAIAVALVLGVGTVAGVVFLVIAGLMLATAATGFCPNYVWLGITTHPSGVHRVRHGIRQRHA